MENDCKELHELLLKYIETIHTQNEEDFKSIWTNDEGNSLISITDCYEGVQSIYEDFVIGKIQKAYKTIDLIAEEEKVKFLDENTAIIIFSYHTECIRRETDEEYGIAGLETQVVKKINGKWKYYHIHYSK